MAIALTGARPLAGRWRMSRDVTAERMREIVYRLLCVFWFTMPGEGVVRIGGESTISKGVGVVLAVAAAISLVQSGRRTRANDYILVILAFAGWVALSVFWSVTESDSQERVVTMAQLMIMVLITWEFAQSDRRIRGLMVAWSAGCLAISAIIIFAFATGASQARYTAPGTHPGDQAYSLLLAIPMVWYLSLRTHRPALAVAYRLFVPLAMFAVVLTASRAALLSMVLALLIIPFTLPRASSRLRASVGVGLFVGVAAALAVIASNSGPVQRLSTTSSEISSGTLDERTTLWSIAFRLIGQHPLVGVGAGGSKSAIGAQYLRGRSVHNTLLNIPVELGLIGIALFLLAGLAATYRALTRLPWLETRLAWVLLIVFVAALIPRPDDYSKSTYAILTLFALMGAVWARPSPAQAAGGRRST